MNLEKATAAGWRGIKGKGFVLYGNRPDTGKWIEQWHSTAAIAMTFCKKRKWKVIDLTRQQERS